MKASLYDLPSLKDACEKEIERVRRLRESDGQNNITFNFRLGYEYGIKYVLYCLDGYALCEGGAPRELLLGTGTPDNDGRVFDPIWGMYVDEFEDFTDDEQQVYQSVLDEQYKDTGVNIDDLI